MSDELKIKRGHKKAAFTKSINKLRRAVCLKDDSIIPELLMVIQQEFDALQLAHDEYHETLTEEASVEESEQYFELLDESYVVALKELGSYREAITRPDENVLAQVLSLPRIEIEKFDGNPMNYYNFVAVFNECVDKEISDCQTKLVRLFQLTIGDAKNAIRACVSTGGSKGYADAHAILKNRFGNDHLVCATLLKGLRDGDQVKSPIDMLKLYDYLRNLRFPCNVRVDFLIGQDNAGMLVPLEVRHGIENELFATRTLYGWCLNGPVMTSKRSTAGVCNFVSNEVDDRLDRLSEIEDDGNNTVKQSNSCDDMNEISLREVC